MQKITIIALGNKMPSWVLLAQQEFCKRLQEFITATLIEIPLVKRGKPSDLSRIMEKEKTMLLDAIPTSARRIALDIQGESFGSEALAEKIKNFQRSASQICFLIGGPEGLLPEILELCEERWSLSKLTLPHTLARIVLLETLYRAYTIIENHPYHK